MVKHAFESWCGIIHNIVSMGTGILVSKHWAQKCLYEIKPTGKWGQLTSPGSQWKLS